MSTFLADLRYAPDAGSIGSVYLAVQADLEKALAEYAAKGCDPEPFPHIDVVSANPKMGWYIGYKLELRAKGHVGNDAR